MTSPVLDTLNHQLQTLALTAQQHPPLSTERQAALRQLMSKIWQSGALCRPQRGCFSGQYEDIYAEAIQELFYYMCKNIDKYNPDRAGVLTWVNMLLRQRFFREAIPRVIGKPDRQHLTLDNLENLAAPKDTVTRLDCIKEVVETDSAGTFSSAHIRGYPEATFKALFLRRLAQHRWQDIAKEFGFSTSTAQSFFTRYLQKFAPLFRDLCFDYAD